MKIFFYVFGAFKNSNYKELANYYGQLITKYESFELVVLKDRSKGALSDGDLSPRLKDMSHQSALVVGLSEAGKPCSSVEFSHRLKNWKQKVQSVHLFCGNAFGFDASAQRLFQENLSLSPMTFPHELAAVVLLEQVFRGLNIAAGGKYHH